MSTFAYNFSYFSMSTYEPLQFSQITGQEILGIKKAYLSLESFLEFILGHICIYGTILRVQIDWILTFVISFYCVHPHAIKISLDTNKLLSSLV